MRTKRRSSLRLSSSFWSSSSYSTPYFLSIMSPSPRQSFRFSPFNRRFFQTGIISLFMVYVVLCLHDLRHQMRDVQIVLRVDDDKSIPESTSVVRQTRAIRDNAVNGPSRATVADLLRPEKHTNVLHEKPSRISPAKQELLTKDQLNLDDLHISVKTSKKFHRQRLDLILQTWFKDAKMQTYFVTDEDDEEYVLKTDGHLVNSNCSNSHHRNALCCKMSTEIDLFLLRNKRWFCHFDDDNYVNVENLRKLLDQYDPAENWYLGKPSIKAPLELPYLQSEGAEENQKSTFWFATGGAGFCLSRALVKKMEPVVSKGKFMNVGEKIRLPDDVTIGYVVEAVVGVPLTVVSLFHSHLEPLNSMDMETLRSQITFSYSTYRGNEMNTVSITGWKTDKDPTRFLSLYCFFHSDAKDCTGFTHLEKNAL